MIARRERKKIVPRPRLLNPSLAAKCELGATENIARGESKKEECRRRKARREGGSDRPTDRRLRAFRVIDERSYRRIKSANARSSSKRESEVSPSGNGESEAARLGRVKTTSASMQKRGEGSRGRGVREGRRQAELPFFSPQGKRESGIADKSARFDEKRAPSARQTE